MRMGEVPGEVLVRLDGRVFEVYKKENRMVLGCRNDLTGDRS